MPATNIGTIAPSGHRVARRTWQIISIPLLIWLIILAILPSPLHSEEVTAKQVDEAIRRGVDYLLSKQNRRTGGWSEYPDQNCGATSLIVLALINSGVSPSHPQIVRAMEYLRGKPAERTYSVALQTMAFCAASPNQDMLRIRQNVQWLVESQIPQFGSWSYSPFHATAGIGDPSNTQFALLAISEAQRLGVVVPPEVYQRSLRAWEGSQNRDGSWRYFSGENASGSMTSAGIASLVITMGQLGKPQAIVKKNEILCCGQTDVSDDRINLALDWLGRNFQVSSNPGSRGYQLYYLYGLERVGRLTGQRKFGEHDWYREGCEALLSQQDRLQGFFSSRTGGAGEDETQICTSFALLFLSKGKRQIVISRLEHGPKQNWNIHGFAMQNLTGHIEQAWKRDLAWQTIDLTEASLKDLLETPILFISGRDELKLSDGQKELLKQYVQQGGFIFAEACQGNGCKGEAFDKSFRKLIEELFGQPLLKLPPTHPIWFAETKVDPKNLPENFWLYGIDACCRTSIVYSPSPMSCRWELAPIYGTPTSYPESVQVEINNFVKIGLNVAAYATSRKLKEKLDAVAIVNPESSKTESIRGMLMIPKLQHAAGANDAPRAIPNLLEWLRNEQPTDINSQALLITATPEELEKHPIIFMHGRGKFEFSDAERKAIREYLQRGGFLFADAICADADFAESFRKEVGLILPDQALQAVPTDHPMLTDSYEGFDIRSVTLFDPLQKGEGEGLVSSGTQGPPVLEQAILSDRVVVVFSPFDLSCALESQQSLQCKGYSREDAARIAMNIILLARLQ